MPSRTRNGPTTGMNFMNGGAVRFGPTRSWIHAEILRSAKTEYATRPCTTPTTIAILTRLKMIKFQSILNWHRHAGVAQSRPHQAVERGNIFRHFVEQTFNRHKTVPAGDVVDEVMQKFPLGARVPGCLDGLHELLDPALDVREGAALFRVCT